MKLTDRELAAAKRQLQRMRDKQLLASRINDPTLSAADRELIRKYPRHTLEAARLIESTPADLGIGHLSGFDRLVAQEKGRSIKGDHT